MLITNGKIITWGRQNQILEDHAIKIDGDKIIEIGPQDGMLQKYPDAKKIDAHGQYIMPGNICAHTHFYGAFSRGMALHGSPPRSFPEILDKLWWPLDKSLDGEAVRYSAYMCLIDAIKHGTTTLLDHHASANSITGSLDEIAQAVKDAGLRVSLCYEVSDRDGEKKAKEGIEENKRFIEYVRKEKPLNGRLAANFGLHASLTLSEQTLNECRKATPEDVGFHIHVAEHVVDQYDSLEKYGTRIVDRLERHGILGPHSIVVHGVNIDAREIAILAESGSWVTHQPRSNMNNAVGVAAVEAMLRSGIPVCLGNDGFSNAMWDEWRSMYLIHKAWNLDPSRMNGMDVVQAAIYNNSDLASHLFAGGRIGEIAEGAKADLIFVDYYPYTELNSGNLPWHILFGFRDSLVTTTIVDGEILMRDRELLTLDEEEIHSKTQEIVPKVWQRYQSQFG